MKLVLGTSNDKPNGKWLENLRRIVRKGGLNCGDCTGCRTNLKCRRWWLHKSRATFTTTCSVQGWMRGQSWSLRDMRISAR